MDRIESAQPLADMAQAWFVKLMDPDCPGEERAAFERWRAADPAHARAYAEATMLWERLAVISEAPEFAGYVEEALKPPAAVPVRAEPTSSPGVVRRDRRRWRLPAAAVAMTASLAFAWVGASWFLTEAPTPATVYEAGDRPIEVRLHDGTQVHLDVRTRVTVSFEDRARRVDLVSGRALFEVAHDPVRPFTVHAEPGEVRALGTVFQVRREDDAVTVVLSEGAVLVRHPSVGSGAGVRDTRLRPGQEMTFSATTEAWQPREVDTELATNWTRGRLVFRETPLRDAVLEINRYSDRQVRLEDPGLGTLPLSGTFVLGDAESVVTIIPEVLPVRTAYDEVGNIVIRSR